MASFFFTLKMLEEGGCWLLRPKGVEKITVVDGGKKCSVVFPMESPAWRFQSVVGRSQTGSHFSD